MYRAPLKEIQFVLHRLLGAARLAELPVFADYSDEFMNAVLEEGAKFAERVLDPINRTGDLEGARWTPTGVQMPASFKDAYEQFMEAGWPRLRAPVEHGGQGAPIVLSTAVEELWASANLAFKLCPMLTQGAVEALERCGSEELQRIYLPNLVSGAWTGTMNLTEPQAGSDLGALRTRAVRDGNHYRIFGQKIFITYGEHDLVENIVHLVLARVEGAPAGTKGISLFVVPKFLVTTDGKLGERNDVRCTSIEHKLGIHGSPTCVLVYGDKEGAIGYLVGEENRGLEYMFIMMNAARLAVGLEGYSIAERAYQKALEWARDRVQGRPAGATRPATDKPLPIAYHADVKRMLLSMKSQTDAARAIALYAAMQLDLGRHHEDPAARKAALARGELLIPIVKAWSTELGTELTSLGIQIHGGMGYVEETGAAQYYRDARIAPIYEGTTGIQAIDLVGRKIARDGGAAIKALLLDITTELRKSTSADPAVRESHAAALEAVARLEKVTDKLLQLAKLGPEHTQAVAVPYMTLCGVVIGAWLMARAHEIAVESLAEDRDFYSSKRQTARFYLQHVLPQSLSLEQQIDRGGSIVDTDPALF